LDAVLEISRTAQTLVREHVEPGEAEFRRDLPDLAIEAPSFRVEFRLQQDLLDWRLQDSASDERTMLAIRFGRPRQSLPEDSWTIHVRGHWPTRVDRLARRGKLGGQHLRRLFSPRRRKAGVQYPVWNDDVYVMRGTPSHDIAAQIALFVLQTGLSPDADGTLFNWLQSYIVKNFKHRGVERHDLSAGIVTHLLKYKWWMEDARAWRKYIAATRDGLRRSSAEHSRRPSRDRPVNAAYDGTGAVYSVDEAAHILRRSRSTIYRMLEDRRLDHTIDKNERMVISR
jgi:hypothetical protein